jgi:hypothetical protein
LIDVRYAPIATHELLGEPKKKAARRATLNSNLMIVDQAAINAGFDFRR